MRMGAEKRPGSLRNMPPNSGSWSAYKRSLIIGSDIISWLGQIVNDFRLLIFLVLKRW